MGDPGQLLARPLRAICGPPEARGALELIEVQLEGRKRIAADAFANGQRIAEATFWENRKVDLPLGYRYSATYAGIRQAEKDDLALIVSGLPAAAAGRLHAEPRAGRAGEALPPPPGAHRAARWARFW